MQEFQNDPTIDGTLNKGLIGAILKHVAKTSQLFNSTKSERKLDMFEGSDVTQVFLHYVYLIDAKFINGGYDIQSGLVRARWVTWEGHELLSSLGGRSFLTH
jgi:hypothetical protein